LEVKKMRGHRDLAAWQQGMLLVKEIYWSTQDFPKHEIYGLANQLRRAAVSIPSNLAEGASRNSRKEFHHFIGNARGSLAEVETQVEIAKDLGYFSEAIASSLLKRIAQLGRLLTGLRNWSRSDIVVGGKRTEK
jgi:four helix bundle protein